MDSDNKRKHARVEAVDFISQESMDEEGQCISQGMAKALDVSRAGLKLETPYPIEGYLISLAIVDIDEELIEIIGEPLYCRQIGPGVYHTGMQFIGSEKEISEFTVGLVRLHNHRKQTCVEVSPEECQQEAHSNRA